MILELDILNFSKIQETKNAPVLIFFNAYLSER
ncbi:hypothetical protein MTsPCn9_34150 [Croceitalea sp. MTPC9]|nr:hypothetical protein MTsPCn6_34800 [Croceitalea sp. MTPC6]GMN18475.1 hypothetical protein MTsPCn9_34150 [Croceitalea sp. MTPC9]